MAYFAPSGRGEGGNGGGGDQPSDPSYPLPISSSTTQLGPQQNGVATAIQGGAPAIPPLNGSSSGLELMGGAQRTMNSDNLSSTSEAQAGPSRSQLDLFMAMNTTSSAQPHQQLVMESDGRAQIQPMDEVQDPWEIANPPPLDPRSGPYAASDHMPTQFLERRSPSPSRGNLFFANGDGVSLALSVSSPSSRSSSVAPPGEYSPQGRRGVKTGLVYSHLMMLHTVPGVTSSDEGDFHPEQPDRISRIFDYLKDHGCVAHMKRIQIREVKREEILLVHDAGMWEGVEKTACECLSYAGSRAYSDKAYPENAPSLHHGDVGLGDRDAGAHRFALY